MKKIVLSAVIVSMFFSISRADRDVSLTGKNPCDTVLGPEEQALYRLIMEYRKSKDLPEIPVSQSLSHVAQVHARDLDASRPSGQCNCHSWSGNGPWKACCYTADHAQAKCMWDKPRELTGYKGNGYEISSWHSGNISAAMALQVWKNSPGHKAVMVNAGAWGTRPWKAIGIGIYGSYAVVWFGREEDPCGQ